MFRDRNDAGQRLAMKLKSLPLREPLVLAIPRGGVVVGYELARCLHADLDVVLAHKLRSPLQPELAMGSICEDGKIYVNPGLRRSLGVSDADWQKECDLQQMEIDRRKRIFRGDRVAAPISGRSVILTDDGIATGSTMMAAIGFVRSKHPHELILAIPVASPARLASIGENCDRVVCLEQPEDFMAVGEVYEEFLPVSDKQVADFLNAFV